MTLPCENASVLVPSYLDGELSEEQASPLRRHLLDCPACREVAKGEQALKRWFVEPEPVAVPSGFAARVARRAFAGDTGVLPEEPAASELESTPEPIVSIVPFVQRLTAVAAAILLIFALAIRGERLPEDSGLQATDVEILDELERLNELEAAEAAAAEASEEDQLEDEAAESGQ